MRIWMSALLLASAASAMPALAQDAPPPRGQWQSGGRPEGGQPNGAQAPRGQGDPRQFQQGGPGPGPGPGYGQQRPPQAPDGGGARPQQGFGGRPDGMAVAPGRDRGPGYGYGQQAPGGRDPRGQQGFGNGGEPGRGPGGDGRHFDGRPDNGVQVWRGRPGGDDRRGPEGGYRDGRSGYSGGYDRNRPDRGSQWNRGWRDDRRYDWSGWRDSHRSLYRPGRYYAPQGYGYGYRRFGVGTVIAPAFFAQNYWIGDPGYYRLPPADGPYRWVRYYNDALLVDVYSGQVVDAIPDFFW